MPTPAPSLPTLSIVAWNDPIVDAIGFDPRSPYVEKFWLGILGPSTTLLLRHIAHGFDREPDGFELSLGEAAAALGLGDKGGRNAPVVRSVARGCQFGAAMFIAGTTLAVRRRLAPLSRVQVARLPAELRSQHNSWVEFDVSSTTAQQQRRRCRRLALSLAELDDDPASVEHQLHRWQFHPALAREAAEWAVARHAEGEGATSSDLGGDAA